MTNKYREAIERLGLNVLSAGRTVGISRRQTQRFAAGEKLSAPVRKLLWAMERYGIDPQEVEEA